MDDHYTRIVFISEDDQRALTAFSEIRDRVPEKHKLHKFVAISPGKNCSRVTCSCGQIFGLLEETTSVRSSRPYSLETEKVVTKASALGLRFFYGEEVFTQEPETALRLSDAEGRALVAYLSLYRHIPHKLRKYPIKGIFLSEGVVWDIINVEIEKQIVSVDDELCYKLLVQAIPLAGLEGKVGELTKELLRSDTAIPAEHALHTIRTITSDGKRNIFGCSCGKSYRRRNVRLTRIVDKFRSEFASPTSVADSATGGASIGTNGPTYAGAIPRHPAS